MAITHRSSICTGARAPFTNSSVLRSTGAFDLYTGIREEKRMPAAWEWTAILTLYIAALNSKELAVTLPLALGCYELIWHRPACGWAATARWIGAEGRGMVMTGLLTVPYVIGKLTGAGALGGFTLAIDEVLAATALEHDLTLATSGISPLSESPF
jgi:hypothetical protein